eukprot:5085366-Amphidinium_carterae.1
MDPKDVKGASLLAEVQQSNFEGVSGVVSFDAQSDRAASYEVWNAVPDGTSSSTLVNVGIYNAITGAFSTSVNLYWVGGTQGSTPPASLLECPFGFEQDSTTRVCEPCRPGVGCGYNEDVGFPIGILGPFTSVNQAYLAAAIAFDLDFQKNFNQSVRD